MPATTGRIFGVAARCFRSREFGSLGDCGNPRLRDSGTPRSESNPATAPKPRGTRYPKTRSISGGIQLIGVPRRRRNQTPMSHMAPLTLLLIWFSRPPPCATAPPIAPATGRFGALENVEWNRLLAEQGNQIPFTLFTLFTVETLAQVQNRATQNNPVHPANPAILSKTWSGTGSWRSRENQNKPHSRPANAPTLTRSGLLGLCVDAGSVFEKLRLRSELARHPEEPHRIPASVSHI